MRWMIGFIWTLCTLWVLPAQAAPMKMVFYYPGGQGSPEQARPILDGFSQALAKASGGKIKAKVEYFSDAAAGQTFIQTQKPAAGILTLDVFLAKGPAWGMEVIAKTLQLPSADGSDQYFILGNKTASLPASGPITVRSSRSLDSQFLTGKLFPTLGNQIQLKTSPNLIGEMRKIGMGKESGFVLLTQFEYTMISRLKTAWAGNLKVLAESPKISSAPFVVFTNNISPEERAQLQQALVKLSKDPEAKEILQLLRLKGFQKANSVGP